MRQAVELARVLGERLAGPERVAARVRADGFVAPASGRSYRVISPRQRTSSEPYKVLFALHAYATAPEVLVAGFSLTRHAVEERGWLLVVPEGRRDAGGQFHWNASAACCGEGPRHDDLGYLRDVLCDVGRRFAIDARQVFAFGVSNGGFMAYRWACSGDLAAIVNVCGAGQGPDDPACSSVKPVSVLHIHGTNDEVIAYEGKRAAPSYPSAADSVARWLAIDGCTAPSVLRQRRSLFLEPIRVETWAATNARVSLWSVGGGDHRLRCARFFTAEFLDFLEHR